MSGPEGRQALRLLQMAYRGELKASSQQIRAAIEALPFESPKLTAVALASMSGGDFATKLERCIERSGKAPLMIEARAEPTG